MNHEGFSKQLKKRISHKMPVPYNPLKKNLTHLRTLGRGRHFKNQVIRVQYTCFLCTGASVLKRA